MAWLRRLLRVELGETREVVIANYLLTRFVTELMSRGGPMQCCLLHSDYRAGFRFGTMTLAAGSTIADIAQMLTVIVAVATAS